MKYVQVKFTISPDSQTARDLIMAFAGDCGFESFTDDSEPLLGYCQVENYHEDELKNILTMIPLRILVSTLRLMKWKIKTGMRNGRRMVLNLLL